MTVPTSMAEVDLTDLDLCADGFPYELFALHRREEAPVWWHEPTDRRTGIRYLTIEVAP